MRRETQNVLLVLLGGAVLKISLNGEYLRYVKPSLQPWLIAAGVFTIAVAVTGIIRDLRTHPPQHTNNTDHDHADPDHTDHEHTDHEHTDHEHTDHDHADRGHEHSSRSPWLLLLPALAIFLVAPPALGADKVLRSGSVIAAQPAGSDFVDLPDEDAPLLKLGDAVTRAVWDDSGSLDNREIRLIGFTVRTGDGTTYLARLTIGCCAADAAPIKLRLQGDGINTYEPDTWLEARGTMLPDTATDTNGHIPTFAVTTLTPIPAPEDQYEY